MNKRHLALRQILMIMVVQGWVSHAWADITVSAAISLAGVLEKVQPALEAEAGEKISFTFGASGTLAGQIQQGAPVDLFISADRANVEKLVAAKVVEPAAVTVIAENALVLIQPKGAAPLGGFADLAKVKRIAIGEPKVVPAGMYARETLVSLKLWEELEKAGKLVSCENVAQVVTLVDRGEVDAGLVYRTDALNAKNVRLAAEAEASTHSKIEYVSAVVAAGTHKAAAEKLQRALASEKVVAVLRERGFVVAGKSAAPEK